MISGETNGRPAGVGKSHVIRECIDLLKHQRKIIALVAPTGVAAVNINGTTIHSWAGILDSGLA